MENLFLDRARVPQVAENFSETRVVAETAQ